MLRDGTSEGDWPSGPSALRAALQELAPKLADADLFIASVDDGRLFVNRSAPIEHQWTDYPVRQ